MTTPPATLLLCPRCLVHVLWQPEGAPRAYCKHCGFVDAPGVGYVQAVTDDDRA